MQDTKRQSITVNTTVNAPIEKVWQYWSSPEHITKWNNASDDWHSPTVENDLRNGGKFNVRMEAKDGSMGFDFYGTYDDVQMNRSISYTIGDGRKVHVDFTSNGPVTTIKESFEP